METEPTPAGAASILAESEGCLREFIVETMREEWEFGNNIAEDSALAAIAVRCSLDVEAVLAAAKDPTNLATLEQNVQEAEDKGVIGVPTFVIDDEIFWGQDRVEFVEERLNDMRARRL